MSVAAFGLGLMHYWRRHHLFGLHERYAVKLSSPIAFERVYRHAVRTSTWLILHIDNRSLQRYLALFLVFVLALGSWLLGLDGNTIDRACRTEPAHARGHPRSCRTCSPHGRGYRYRRQSP